MRVDGLRALERVRADQFRQAIGLVGGGPANRTHLMEYNAPAALGELPGGFAAGKPATYHVHRTGIMNRHALTIAMRWSVRSLTATISMALASFALHAQEAPSPRDPDSWFQVPCLPDSVDSFEWTR